MRMGVMAQLPTHCRWCPAQLLSDRPNRQALPTQGGDPLPFQQRQVSAGPDAPQPIGPAAHHHSRRATDSRSCDRSPQCGKPRTYPCLTAAAASTPSPARAETARHRNPVQSGHRRRPNKAQQQPQSTADAFLVLCKCHANNFDGNRDGAPMPDGNLQYTKFRSNAPWSDTKALTDASHARMGGMGGCVKAVVKVSDEATLQRYLTAPHKRH